MSFESFENEYHKKIQMELLPSNKFSRPEIKLKNVKGIVIHWVADPKATGKQIRDYFSSLSKQNDFDNRMDRFASTQLIVGLDGEVICDIPLDEVAYHCGAKTYQSGITDKLGAWPNGSTIGIECCHTDWKGNMTDLTYDSLVKLTKWLLKNYKLSDSNLYRHYDITGKDCHHWFVENENEWQVFKHLASS